jgi:hypothetical protein
MKTHCTQSRGLITLLAVLSLAVGSQFSTTFAQGSAFTYQGRLNDSGGAATGTYDLQFTLFDAGTNGSAVAGPITNSPTVVSNGLFTVTLDFGASPFTGADLWLEIAARATNGVFTVLSPRQKITATPYSVTARNVTGVLPGGGLSGTYPGTVTFNNAGNSFSGSFSGSGAGLTLVNAASLGGLSANQFWKTAGNSGTPPNLNFVGTTDNQPLEFRVNNLRGLRLQPGSNSAPSVVGGSRSNIISLGVAGATIAGGDKNFIESFFPGATSDYAFLGGGSSNYIGYFSFNSVLAGGFQNSLNPNCYYSTIAGGLGNSMGFHTQSSIISGGRSNTISQSVDTSTIGGGSENYVDYLAHYAIIGAGLHNQILSNAEYAVISGGRFNTIGVDADQSAIGGGQNNEIKSGTSCTIAGGGGNSISYFSGTIAGGTGNRIETNSYEATIGGGSGNIIHTNAERATIAGGVFNEAFSDSSYSFIGGGERNIARSNAYHATISGGSNNQINNDTTYCTIGGGKLHTVSANANHATIAGGDGNIAGGEAPAIGGGTLNQIGTGSTYDTIAGGGGNSIGAGTFGATIAGGYVNQVNGNFSFAAGYQAQANHPGTFAWAGGNTMPYASIIPYTCNLYASNGVSMDYSFQTAGSPRGVRYVFVGQNAGNTITAWNGARLTDGGTWQNASDRNRKTDFKEVDPRAVLDKLAAMPVRQWRYTNEDACIKHIGPVAQDFQSAFGLGDDDKSIGTVDADGVALAAIQGLNQKLEERCEKADIRVQNLEAENTELKHELAEIKALLQSLANKSPTQVMQERPTAENAQVAKIENSDP